MGSEMCIRDSLNALWLLSEWTCSEPQRQSDEGSLQSVAYRGSQEISIVCPKGNANWDENKSDSLRGVSVAFAGQRRGAVHAPTHLERWVNTLGIQLQSSEQENTSAPEPA